MKDFSAANLEEKQRMFKKIISDLRTTTMFVGKNKVAYNLKAIIYLAKTKTMVNAKFHNARLRVNWRSLHRFIPDTSYWQDREDFLRSEMKRNSTMSHVESLWTQDNSDRSTL